MYFGMPSPGGPYISQEKIFLPLVPFSVCSNFSWATSTILHCDQIADVLSEHNFTDSKIFEFKPAQLMNFGIRQDSSLQLC